VVQVVVLHVPRFGEHPVEPLPDPLLKAAEREPFAVEKPRFVGVVVAPVARVVRDGGPAAEGPERERHHRERVRRQPHAREAQKGAGVGHEANLFDVLHVRVALLLLQPLAEGPNVLAKTFKVQLSDPCVFRRQRRSLQSSRSGSERRDASGQPS